MYMQKGPVKIRINQTVYNDLLEWEHVLEAQGGIFQMLTDFSSDTVYLLCNTHFGQLGKRLKLHCVTISN